MRDDVVALYVDPRGPYPKLVAEWYDEQRDARTYVGSMPVIVHPPCGAWGPMRHLYRGDDASLAEHALRIVRACGGVLEHPRGSKLWEKFDLPKPGFAKDAFGGFTLAIVQSDWGHVARKRTWLYVVGCEPSDVPVMPAPRNPTHWASGSRTAPRGPVPPGIKVCSATQRRRTPVALAAWLLDLAGKTRRK